MEPPSMGGVTLFSLILLNGGIGSRVGAGKPKQFLTVRGIPILVYSLTVADQIAEISEIVINFPDGSRPEVEKLVRDYAIKTPVTYVEAGATRHESVRLMLEHSTNEHVLIHEAARPLVSVSDFSTLIDSPHDNVSLMLQIPFTVAPVDPGSNQVTGSLERDSLRNVQLPQKFSRADLSAAHVKAAERGEVFTEDATLAVHAGYPVYFVEGKDVNIKVTTPTDVRIAHLLLSESEESYE